MESKESATASDMKDPQDGSHSASDSESANIVAMMGFSSFGAKPDPPSKKRKLDQQAASRVGAESRNGSNSMRLGKPGTRKKEVAGEPQGSVFQGRDQSGDSVNLLNPGGEGKASRNEEVECHVMDNLTMSTVGASPEPGLQASGQRSTYDRRAITNEKGVVAYYDASFVEDPWKHLR